MDLTPTPSQTVGPYLHLGLTDKRTVSCVAGHEVEGERVCLMFRVIDGEGAPVPDAMIELWQADSKGEYHGADTPAETVCFGFGRSATADDGSCRFETIKPGKVEGPHNTLQAPHINVSVLGRGILKR